MASPFPGMDPYIEHPNIWSDFHHNLASEIQGVLNPVIRPKYVARIVPLVTYELIEVAETKSRMIRPDVGVYGRHTDGETQGNSAIITPAPEMSRVLMEMPLQLATIEIRLVETMELVTAIEILSPVNKKLGHDAHMETSSTTQPPLPHPA
ncbi:MAG: DUF4058 family protein [Chloroflexota bacterium]